MSWFGLGLRVWGGVAYLIVNFWLITITLLQHTHPGELFGVGEVGGGGRWEAGEASKCSPHALVAEVGGLG